MGSKFFINYLRQKWCQMPELFATVALYWVCGYTQYSCGLLFTQTAEVSKSNRLANRPGMAGIVRELTHGVPCPGRGSFCPGNVKIDHRACIYGCSLMSVLYFVLCLSVTHDLT